MGDLITPSREMGYSNIYLDFLSGADSARHFYSSVDIDEVAAALQTQSYDRTQIADILADQNKRYDAADKTFHNIERIRDPRAVCIFAGQQAVLFGGPFLIVLKALGVVKAASRYEAQLNRPVIPMFWIAGDDHDFDEVNHTWVLDRTGEPTRIAYESPPASELPTSQITFADHEELKRAAELLNNTLGDTDFTTDLYRIIEESYRPGATFVEAFGKLMASLMADFGLVLFSPGDPKAKEMAVPFFKEILARREELHAIITATNRDIEEHGYHLQVIKKDDASHLFCNFDGRKPVQRDGDRYLVDQRHFSNDELVGMIESEPQRFSPDVMLRPVLQSYLFPVLTQKGGPSEIAYLAQINPLFGLFNRVAPYYMARPSATLVEARHQQQMTDYQISFSDLSGDIEQVINRVLTRSFPENLESSFAQLKYDVEHRFGEFVRQSLEFDPALKQFASQTYGKIDYTLKQFEGKVFSSHKKKSKQTRDRLYRLWNALYPNRALQERSLNISFFLSRYGLDLMRFLYDRIDCDERSHQLIYLSEYRT